MINKIRINNKTREPKQYNEVLGLLGENKYETLRFTFDEFIDGLATLIVKKYDTQGNLQNYFINLTKEDDSYTLEVQSSLLDVAGEITMELIVRNEDHLIFKSLPFTMIVLEAMEAEQEIPEQYPTWEQSLIQKYLQVDNKLAEITALEQDLESKRDNGYFNGTNGVSPTVSVETISTGVRVTITDVNGEHEFTVLNGQDGQADAQTVAQAVQNYLEQNPIEVPTKTSDLTNDSNFASISDMTQYIEENKEELKGDKGDKGDTGEKGQDGYTPVKGTDYWTNADKQEIKDYCDEQIGIVENLLQEV